MIIYLLPILAAIIAVCWLFQLLLRVVLFSHDRYEEDQRDALWRQTLAGLSDKDIALMGKMELERQQREADHAATIRNLTAQSTKGSQ